MRIRRYAVLAAILTGMLAVSSPPAASADPTQAELRKLTKQAAQLNKLYRGQIQSLEETRLQAKKAADAAEKAKQAQADVARDVSRWAALAYMAGPVDGFGVFSGGGDPYAALGQAASLTYMAEQRAGRLAQVRTLIADAKKARVTADAKIEKLKQELKKMQGKRREVERLLAKYGFQTPSGSNGLTGRMVSVRDEVMQNFPMPYGVGCLRAGDPGEHGKGRACDFMMTSGGRAASGADEDRGDALAQWLIDNGQRLGVMYIIWKQRYYDIRSGSGWDPMSNRGGVTANHYDHVHVSVF